MPPSLTDLPLLVLELIFTSTRYPQELLRSCRVFYELSKSPAIRAQWIIYNFGFHAIEAAVLDFSSLFGVQESTFCPGTLGVLLNMYGSVPRYILGKIDRHRYDIVLEYIRGCSDHSDDNPTDSLAVNYPLKAIPSEFDHWFIFLDMMEKSDEDCIEDLEYYLRLYGLPGLWAMTCTKREMSSKARFFYPAFYKKVTRCICFQHISVQILLFLLEKGLPVALPLHEVERRTEAQLNVYKAVVIHSENGKISDTYLHGRDFVGEIDIGGMNDILQREVHRKTKSLATADMDSMLFALIHEQYDVAEVLRDHDAKRWETPWGKDKLRYMNVVLRALNNDKALALLPKLLDEDEIARVEEKANELRIVMDLLKRIIDLDVDGARDILRANSILMARVDIIGELGVLHRDLLEEIERWFLDDDEFSLLKNTRKMQYLVEDLVKTLQEAQKEFRTNGHFPKDLFLSFGDDLSEYDYDYGFDDEEADDEYYGETPPEYEWSDEESEMDDDGSPGLGPPLPSAGHLNIDDSRSDSISADSGDGKEVGEDELVFDDEREDKEGEMSSVDSGDLEGKEWDYGEGEEEEEEEVVEDMKGGEEEEKTGEERGVVEDLQKVEYVEECDEFDEGYDNFAYEWESNNENIADYEIMVEDVIGFE